MLSGADLGGLAVFLLTVDFHLAGGNEVLALSAAVGDTHEFQEIAEPDVIAFQLEFNRFHREGRMGVVWVPERAGGSSTENDVEVARAIDVRERLRRHDRGSRGFLDDRGPFTRTPAGSA